MDGFEKHPKDFIFHPEGNREPLRGFKNGIARPEFYNVKDDSEQEKKNEGGIKGVNRKCLSQEVVSSILCRKGEQLYWDL